MKELLMLLPYVEASSETLRIAKGENYLATRWKDMVRINKQLWLKKY